jgi:DNA-binding transcriptional ArsR family regulator
MRRMALRASCSAAREEMPRTGKSRYRCDMLETMGMEAFAERARRELRATGVTARKRTPTAGAGELTAQLFLSARTVQYHLRIVFAKLGISSRSQLASVLPECDVSRTLRLMYVPRRRGAARELGRSRQEG